MYHFVWRSVYKQTLPNSVPIEGPAIGESYMMELFWEVGIVSCSIVHPWMEPVKGDFFSIFEAFLQPYYFLPLLLFGTIPLLSLYPLLALLLRIHSRHRG